jgi:hypothetical protein
MPWIYKYAYLKVLTGYRPDTESLTYYRQRFLLFNKACFKRRILVASNAIQTTENEKTQLINYCLNCIRRDENSTSETGLSLQNICVKVT